MPTAPRMAAQDWALLVLLSLLWGGSFFFAKIAVAECNCTVDGLLVSSAELMFAIMDEAEES